jgi:hypothetical protein
MEQNMTLPAAYLKEEKIGKVPRGESTPSSPESYLSLQSI